MKTLIATSILLAGMTTVASAAITLPRNTVLEATADQDISIKDRRAGDRFSVTVQNDRDLPRGTRVYGMIERIESARDGRPAYMDLSFERIEFPGGNRDKFAGVPVPLDAKGIERGRDGRLIANPKKVKTENYVLGGFLGGLVVGALAKKPFEGAFLGTLAGIVLGESERQSSKKQQDLVMRKGNRLGVLLTEELRVDDRWDRNDDRIRNDNQGGGWDRDDNRNGDRNDVRNGQEFQFEGRTLTFGRDTEPYREGDEWMIPLQAVARELRLEVDRREDRLWIDGPRTSARLRLNDREVRLDGQRGSLPTAVIERNGEIFVPAGLLASLAEGQLTIGGTRVRPWTLNQM